MAKIKQLPPHEAHKIAAGEVVERPASIVKELIENALDAGATQICVYTTNGGQTEIRIVDNGCGMDEADAQMCFAQFATSKIERVDDLSCLQTFGFRGEALASIAAVSTVTLLTREHTADHGIQIEHAESEIKHLKHVSCAPGTDITIANLFYNVPARKKFLKKVETEWRAIVHLFEAFCFQHLSVHFKLFSAHSLIHNCPPVKTTRERIYQLWPASAQQHMLDLLSRSTEIGTVSGTISHSSYTRYDRTNIFFFVNKRWVKNSELGKALLKGYGATLPPGKYPAACISLEVPTDEVDINVHPRKEEVRFAHPRRIEMLLQEQIKKTFEQQTTHRVNNSVKTVPSDIQISAPQIKTGINFFSSQSQHRISSAPWQIATRDAQTAARAIEKPSPVDIHVLTQKAPLVSEQTQLPVQSAPSHTIIGYYKKTYIMLEHDEGILYVDQHAAHERILYELFEKKVGAMETINLLFPHLIELTTNDIQSIEPHLGLFSAYGLVVELFDATHVVVRATPAHLKHLPFNELIKEAIGILSAHETLSTQEVHSALHHNLRALMACKAAVKAGDQLTPEHMRQLLTDLAMNNNRFSCPHGRPTSWLLTTDEIEKKFKRKL